MKLVYHSDRWYLARNEESKNYFYPESWPELISPKSQYDWTLRLLESDHKDIVIVTHSEAILCAVRLAIKNKIVAPEDIELAFISNTEDINISIDEDGRLSVWPEGFCDAISNWLKELL